MFGEKLKKLRKERHITQEQLAAIIGVERSSIGKYEGKSGVIPSSDVLNSIADYFGVSLDYLMGRDDYPAPPVRQVESLTMLPVIGTIRCGPGGLAYQDIEAYIPAANVRHPDECFYLRVEGDSMEPAISEGDLALIHKQPDVESGELAAVVIDGEEGTLKKVIKKGNSLILQAFNPAYPPRVFTGHEMDVVCIVGKVIRTEKEW